MKVNVVYDSQGAIISMNTLMPAPTGGAASPQYGVILDKGQNAAEIDIPATSAQWGLADIGSRMRVSTDSGTPTLVLKD